MLLAPAPFPHPGAHAFLKPVGDLTEVQPCRIIQARRDGRYQVSLTGRAYSAANSDVRARASGTRTVDLADLAATAEELDPVAAKAGKPKRARKPGARKASQ